MLYLECPYEILEQRILGRAKFTGRSDDNIENLRLRFETFKAEPCPRWTCFEVKICVLRLIPAKAVRRSTPKSKIALQNLLIQTPPTGRSLKNPKCCSAYGRFLRSNHKPEPSPVVYRTLG